MSKTPEESVLPAFGRDPPVDRATLNRILDGWVYTRPLGHGCARSELGAVVGMGPDSQYPALYRQAC